MFVNKSQQLNVKIIILPYMGCMSCKKYKFSFKQSNERLTIRCLIKWQKFIV